MGEGGDWAQDPCTILQEKKVWGTKGAQYAGGETLECGLTRVMFQCLFQNFLCLVEFL